MMNIHPARVRPADRTDTPSDKRAAIQYKTFPAPIDGMVTNQNPSLQSETAAIALENFWPTARSIVPVGGMAPLHNMSSIADRMFEYRNGETLEFFD